MNIKRKKNIAMKCTIPYCLLLFVFLFTIGCGNNRTNQTTDEQDADSGSIVDEAYSGGALTDATIPDADLSARLKPIRENFRRINAVKQWSEVRERTLWETTEGGDARFYYAGGSLEKVVTRQYGETFQELVEYYLLDGQLSFVFETFYRYNRPFDYDSAAMMMNDDTEAFDFGKSEKSEIRSYFENGELLLRVDGKDASSPVRNEYLREEQRRMTTVFRELLKLEKDG
jgi:hypothetical protein